jgi:diacylglycerol kinase (ATP)
VVPIGCGNDFAKMLGIRTIEDGIKAVAGGRRISVDVGVAADRYFINNVGIGLEAHVVYRKSKLKGNRGQTTYLGPALKTIFTFSCFEAELESRDFTFKGKVSGISIGNGQCHGGIFRLTPNAIIDDGLLDVCIIKETTRIRRLTNVWKVIKGTHASLKEVVTFQTDSLVIRTQEPVRAHTDGELFDKPLTHLAVKVLPKKLQFFRKPQLL